MTQIIKFKLNITDILILAYIVIQLFLLIVMGGTPQLILFVFYFLMFSLVLLLAFFAPREKPSLFHFLKQLFPLIMIYFFYRMIGVQLSLSGFLAQDPLFYNLEKAVLGIYPSFVLQRLIEVWLNEVSYGVYIAGIGLFYWTMAKLYHKDRIEIFENFIFAATLGGLLCLTISSVFPIVGPGQALDEYYYLDFYGPYLSEIVPLLIKFITPGVGGFPSLYFCLLTIAAYYLWDFGKTYIIASFVILTAVFWGGIYLRYHYLLDALAALLIAFLAATTANFIYYLKHGKNVAP